METVRTEMKAMEARRNQRVQLVVNEMSKVQENIKDKETNKVRDLFLVVNGSAFSPSFDGTVGKFDD